MSDGGQAPAHGRDRCSVIGQDCPALPLDGSRASMMRREAELSLAARIELFEALSVDAAWARAAVRVR